MKLFVWIIIVLLNDNLRLLSNGRFGLTFDPFDGLFQLDAIHFHISAAGKAEHAAYAAHAKNAEATASLKSG